MTTRPAATTRNGRLKDGCSKGPKDHHNDGIYRVSANLGFDNRIFTALSSDLGFVFDKMIKYSIASQNDEKKRRANKPAGGVREAPRPPHSWAQHTQGAR